MRTLSVFHILAVAFFFLAAGMVIVPDAESRQRISSEVAAVRLLQRIAVAQLELRSRAGIDRDGDGRPEYGFLRDLLSIADLPVGAPDAFGVAALDAGGYRVAVLLPGADGRCVSADFSAAVHPALAARSFLAVAWPTVAGRGARRVYAVHHGLLVQEMPNDDLTVQGTALPALRLPHLAYREPGSDRIATSDTWPASWSPFLENAQAREIRRRLEQRQLPVPEGIAELAGPETPAGEE